MTPPQQPVFEIVPNISEGRDLETVAACAAAMSEQGVRIINVTSDSVHHRSVLTAVGSGAQTVAAAVALARVALERIDLRRHAGAHPRIGALDVLPFIPLRNATLDDAVTLAHRAATRIWHELGIPAYLYGAAASATHRVRLADVRRGEFEGLARKCMQPPWHFDCGDAPHPAAGAIAVGAREILIAFNVELQTPDIDVARRIAVMLRESSGGLRTLRAIAVRLSATCVQVSCNVTDFRATPLYRVVELIRRLAAHDGVAIGRSELIGLAPREAIDTSARAYLAAKISTINGGDSGTSSP